MRHLKIWSLALLSTLTSLVVFYFMFFFEDSIDNCHMGILTYLGFYMLATNAYNYYVGVSKL